MYNKENGSWKQGAEMKQGDSVGQSREDVKTFWVESVEFIDTEGLSVQACTQSRSPDNLNSMAPHVLE